jgi:hypothetical protein
VSRISDFAGKSWTSIRRLSCGVWTVCPGALFGRAKDRFGENGCNAAKRMSQMRAVSASAKAAPAKGGFVRDAVVNRPNNQWRLTARQEPFAAVEVKVRLADIALVRCGYPKFRFAFTLRCL